MLSVHILKYVGIIIVIKFLSTLLTSNVFLRPSRHRLMWTLHLPSCGHRYWLVASKWHARIIVKKIKDFNFNLIITVYIFFYMFYKNFTDCSTCINLDMVVTFFLSVQQSTVNLCCPILCPVTNFNSRQNPDKTWFRLMSNLTKLLDFSPMHSDNPITDLLDNHTISKIY